jgi:hypothetical protein
LIYLVGSCGFPNYGDELITGKWLRRLARTNPDREVWVDCHSPGQAQAMFAGMHPNLRFTDLLWRICWAAPNDEPDVVVDHAIPRGPRSGRRPQDRHRSAAAAPRRGRPRPRRRLRQLQWPRISACSRVLWRWRGYQAVGPS